MGCDSKGVCQIYVCVMAMLLLSHGKKLFYEVSFGFTRKVHLRGESEFWAPSLGAGRSWCPQIFRVCDLDKKRDSAVLHGWPKAGLGVQGAACNVGWRERAGLMTWHPHWRTRSRQSLPQSCTQAELPHVPDFSSSWWRFEWGLKSPKSLNRKTTTQKNQQLCKRTGESNARST